MTTKKYNHNHNPKRGKGIDVVKQKNRPISLSLENKGFFEKTTSPGITIIANHRRAVEDHQARIIEKKKDPFNGL